jgi:F5/8 type C domain
MKGAVMATDPPYSGTIFLDGKIITAADPTTFLTLTDAGQAERSMFDRRLNEWKTFNAYLFDAKFDDDLAAEIQVNPEFGSSDEARIQAQKYCPVVGKLPTVLRTQLKTVSIHQGEALFGGGNNNLLIHTGQADQYERDGILEEALLHEACHTAFDETLNSARDWSAAQKAEEGSFISTYARDYPQREDVAESFLCYLAVRYRSARISKADADKILEAIPNRIAYFDALPLDMHPIAPPLLKLVKASASSQLAEPYNGKPQTADRLIEGPNDGYCFWNSDDKGNDPTPWFSLQLEHRSVVNSLYIRWKRTHGSLGARPMKYKVLSSLDGKSWTDTKVDQSRVQFLSANMAVDQLLVDQLPGWPNATQYIKVEMSESSYAPNSPYFTCRYVLVRGRAL